MKYINRPITIIILSILATIFFIQNSDHVDLQIFFGNPIRIRLIFLMMIAGIIGYVWSTYNALKKQRQLLKEIKILKKMASK
ncbi:MAG: hypothetical protein HQK49_04805 [Oligoflexia bacterium]|nr:hypothetical protein [Oligoflexia bacterium]